MDYGKVLSRAWEITWRWKVLWILGFLAALGKGGSTGNGSSYSTSGTEWNGMTLDAPFPPTIIALVVGLMCLALLIAIAVWVVSVIARGGLIAGVQQIEDEGATSLGQAWRGGVARFWTLLGISILAAIPLILLGIGGIVGLVIAILGGASIADSSGSMAAAIIVPALCGGGVFCCGMILLAIVLNQIRIYAERAAVLEGLGWLQAFGRGWEVLKANFVPTLVFWIIFFVIGLALGLLIFSALLVMFVPFIAVVANLDSAAWLVAPLCCGGIVAIVVAALISAIIETFTSATWTLAFRELTGLAEQTVVEVVTE